MATTSNSQNSLSEVSPVFVNGVEPLFDIGNHHMTYDVTSDLHFTQALDEMTWINDLEAEQQLCDQPLEDMTLTMSGGLPNPVQVSTGGIEGPDIGVFGATGNEVSHALESIHNTGIQRAIPEQHQGENAGVPSSSSSQKSMAISTQSGRAETNPYRRAVTHQQDQNDSAMELCEARSSSGSGAEEMVLNYLARSATAKGKRPVRPITANTPARKSALKRIEKLMTTVEELYTKIQALNSENRSLHVKIGEVENEKQKLLITLMKIRMEVDMWDELDDQESLELDERIDTLSHSMQNIKLLLPPD